MSSLDITQSLLKPIVTLINDISGRTDKRLRRKAEIAANFAKLPTNPSNTQAIKFGEEQLTLTYFTMISGIDAGSIQNMNLLLDLHKKLGGRESDWTAIRGACEYFSYTDSKISIKQFNRSDALQMTAFFGSAIAAIFGATIFAIKTKLAFTSAEVSSFEQISTIAVSGLLLFSCVTIFLIMTRELGMRANSLILRSKLGMLHEFSDENDRDTLPAS